MQPTIVAEGLEFPEGPVWLGPKRVAVTEIRGQCISLWENGTLKRKIAVTGGFTPAKIRQFEELGVPADIYGVGSWLLSSCEVCGTNNDFTADVVRVRIAGRWYDLAKAGRKACDNLLLERVQ